MAKLQDQTNQCAYSFVFCRCDTVQLSLPEGHQVLLSRIKSLEGGEETVYCGLREAFNKLVQPVSWQTFFGYITRGCKTGEYVSTPICFQHTGGQEGGMGGHSTCMNALDSTIPPAGWWGRG